MKVEVGAFERYVVVGCAWDTWSVFQALVHIRHAFENFWSKMAKILSQWTGVCLVGATPFRSGPTQKCVKLLITSRTHHSTPLYDL